MGQAAVDLPDPLDQQQPPANSAGVDDLLAQLAGDEIDRLLSDADAAPARPAPSRPAPPPAAPAAPAPRVFPRKSPLAKLNDLANLPPVQDAEAGPASINGTVPSLPPTFLDPAATGKGFPVADAPATPPATPASDAAAARLADDEELGTSLGELLDGLDANTAAANEDATAPRPAPFAPAPARAPSSALPPDAGGRATADEASSLLDAPPAPSARRSLPEDEAGTSAAERGALDALVDDELDQAATAGGPLAAAPVAAAVPTPPRPASDDEESLPLLLRPLGWLNAPIDASPEWVRDLVGKAAIVTLVNAVAVLIYVLVFRR